MSYLISLLFPHSILFQPFTKARHNIKMLAISPTYNKHIYTQGELDEHQKLVKVLRQVDTVIVTLGVPQYMEQLKIIEAMKEAGNIKVN